MLKMILTKNLKKDVKLNSNSYKNKSLKRKE